MNCDVFIQRKKSSLFLTARSFQAARSTALGHLTDAESELIVIRERGEEIERWVRASPREWTHVQKAAAL